MRFLRFGCLAWGGPAAQIALIKRECVDEERWVSEETFTKTLAVYQVLPGPEAHELCIYFGRLRGGQAGARSSRDLGSCCRASCSCSGFSMLYVEAALSDNLDEIFYGLKAAVGAIVARAVIRLGRAFVSDVPLCSDRRRRVRPDRCSRRPASRSSFSGQVSPTSCGRTASASCTARTQSRSAPFLSGVALGAVSLSLTSEIFWEGLKAGLVTFGGAFTVIPYLQDVAVGGPGMAHGEPVRRRARHGRSPTRSARSSSRRSSATSPGAWPGRWAMTLGIFLPAFVLPIFFHRFLVAIAENKRIQPFLLGIAAGVVGLIAAVTVDIVDTAVVDVPTAILAVGAFVALMRWHSKLSILYVVLGCGAIGAALQLSGAV